MLGATENKKFIFCQAHLVEMPSCTVKVDLCNLLLIRAAFNKLFVYHAQDLYSYDLTDSLQFVASLECLERVPVVFWL